MKKFILLLVCALVMASCDKKVEKDYIMTITYRMYYPGNVVEKTVTCDVTKDGECEMFSHSGTNYLRVNTAGASSYPKDIHRVESSTVPIELVSYEITKKQ